ASRGFCLECVPLFSAYSFAPKEYVPVWGAVPTPVPRKAISAIPRPAGGSAAFPPLRQFEKLAGLW
ncbi:MAG: hypothetical protein RSD76_07385, partial [Clostridia bacterium]